MTSNVGARLISKGKSLGFMASEENTERDYRKMKDTVMDEVKRVFNPEFINRIDDILVFHPLSEQDMTKILDLMLRKVETKLKDQGFKVDIAPEAKKFLIETGFDPNYGARPLLRTIQRTIEDPLAEEILQKKFAAGATVYINLDEGAKKLMFSDKPLVKAGK